MTPSVASDPSTSARPRRRLVRLTALGVTVGVAAATIVGSTGASAAAAPKPKAQAVGRFLDGSVGGNPIEQLADVVDARATAAPNTSNRNPLEAKLLGQLDLPLGNALQLPGGGALNLGAANQLADANTDGSSLGASGAVSNSGGVSLGGDNSAFPASAQLNLSAAALGSVTLPTLPTLPGLPTTGLPTGSLDALGGITGSIGAVHGIVQTKKGGKIVTPSSGVADVKLNIGSPALGGLLTQLTAILNPTVLTNLIPTSSLPTGGVSSLPGGLGGILTPILGGVGVPTGGATSTDCSLTATAPTSIPLEQGAVVIDIANATISVDVGKLVKVLLGKDISNLDTSNFDLVDFLVTNLPKILSTGLTSLVTGITDPLEAQFKACVGLINAVPVVGSVTSGLITTLLGILDTGKTQLLGAISTVTAPLTSASAAPLTALASGLKQVIDIGLNVQSGPGIQKKETTYPFTTGLEATPNQATPVVAKQTMVRAIEVDVLSAAGGATGSLPALPALGFRQAAAPRTLTAAGGVAVLALGNAAAGPSTATTAVATPTPTPTTSVPNTAIPTGVPAGAAGHLGGGSPALPIVIVLIGLVLAGGGVTAYRFRGKLSH